MINKWYEISCDYCGLADHFRVSIKNANTQYIATGGIIKGNKYFCDKTCYNRYLYKLKEKMKLKVNLKPLSVNAAYTGRHHRTAACKQYEHKLFYMLGKPKLLDYEFYGVTYNFYLVNFSRKDGDNCIKVLQDMIIKKGFIRDDRYIVEWHVFKWPALADRIEIEIKEVKL